MGYEKAMMPMCDTYECIVACVLVNIALIQLYDLHSSINLCLVVYLLSKQFTKINFDDLDTIKPETVNVHGHSMHHYNNNELTSDGTAFKRLLL